VNNTATLIHNLNTASAHTRQLLHALPYHLHPSRRLQARSLARSSCKALAILCIAFSLVACESNQMNDLQQFVTEVKSRKSDRIAPLPEIKPIETFAYTASDRRNPFTASLNEDQETEIFVTDNGIRPDKERRKEELEGMPLDSLRMVGILEQNDAIWGLVRSPDGIIHRVQAGHYMGGNHGQIIRILDDRIEMTEIIPDVQMGYIERSAAISLASKDEDE